jgi:hypothetical protein
VVEVMAKVVMSKSLPVKFASHAAPAILAHMAFGKNSAERQVTGAISFHAVSAAGSF